MRNIVLLFLFVFSAKQSVVAQYRSTGVKTSFVNIKFDSQDETLQVAREIGNLSVVQSKMLYLEFLQINRRHFSSLYSQSSGEKDVKNLEKISLEKENAIKKVLTADQYEIHAQNLKRNERNVVNTNMHGTVHAEFETNNGR